MVKCVSSVFFLLLLTLNSPLNEKSKTRACKINRQCPYRTYSFHQPGNLTENLLQFSQYRTLNLLPYEQCWTRSLKFKKSIIFRQATREGAVALRSSVATTILHVNSAYAHRCFLQRDAWIRGSISVQFSDKNFWARALYNVIKGLF